MKTYLYAIIMLILSHSSLQSQVVITEGGSVWMTEGDIITIQGELTVHHNALLSLASDELILGGDFNQNGILLHTNGQLSLNGNSNQTISGNLMHENALRTLEVSLPDFQNKVNLNSDVQVDEALILNQGILDTEEFSLYISNYDPLAIQGHTMPNEIDGKYSENISYVIGSLGRKLDGHSEYIFPIGDGELGYNPVVLNNQNDSVGMVTASFHTSNLGPINFSDEVDCDGQTTKIKYKAMTGEGYWQLKSSNSISFDLTAFPNASNMNTNPSPINQYRLIKRPDTEDVGDNWTAHSLSSDPCSYSENYFAVIGQGFEGFSKFAIAGYADVNSSIEDIEVDDIGFYPNPVNDIITIFNSGYRHDKKEITILDALGKRHKVQSWEGTTETSLNLMDLIPGYYFLSVSGLEGSKRVFPFVKM